VTVTLVGVGAAVFGTTTATPGAVAGTAVGDTAYLLVVSKRTATTPPTPSNWSPRADFVAVAGSSPADSGGPVRLQVCRREVPTGGLTMPAVTHGGTSPVIGVVPVVVRPGAGQQIVDVVVTGEDVDAGTGYSATAGDALALAAADLLVALTGLNDNGSTASGGALTATGAVFGTTTEHVDASTTNGEDTGVVVHSAPVTTGATAAPRLAMTLSAGKPGGTAFLQVRGISLAQDITAAGIASTAAVGTPTVAPGPAPTSPTGIASGEAVGTPTVAVAAVAATPAGIPSAEAVGTPSLAQVVTGQGVPSGEAIGTPVVFQGATLVPAGIPSAEVVPSPIVAVQPVATTPTGIPPTAAVGTPTLSLVLHVPGIASGEAVGTPTVAVAAVAATPSGIPSAETVPSPVVAPGPVTAGTTGIASGAAVGTPTVTLNLVVSGIASGAAVGTPMLLAGPVAIGVTGIASGEAVGTPTLTITISLEAAPRRRVRIHATYELLLVGRTPQTSGPPTLQVIDDIEWRTLVYADTLSLPQTLTARCPTASLTDLVRERLVLADRAPLELHLLRDGQVVVAGELRGGSEAGEDLTLNAAGLLGYTQRMAVRADLRFTQVDQFAIAAALIDQWQTAAGDWSHGHYGIDTSQVGLSGRLRDREYVRDEQHKVAQRITELGEVLDGFDTEVDPVTRALVLHHPGKGQDRSGSVVFDKHMITSPTASFSIGPDDIATVGLGSSSASGADGVLWSQRINAELRAQFGASAHLQSYSGISDQGTLDARTDAALAARSGALWVPGGSIRVTPDVALDSYGVGDIVTAHISGVLGLQGAWRIRRRQVSVSEQGVESVDLEFV
jgi:hypothetical protein